MITSIYIFLTNNIVVNNILIWLGFDAKMQLAARQWRVFRYNKNKTIQENAGFSHKQEVEDALKKIKSDLNEIVKNEIPAKSNILDFGCGPGIYMKMFADNYSVVGIDVSPEMISQAKNLVPSGKFYLGNFLFTDFSEKFNMIYSISVLEYIPVSKINIFFKRLSSLLEKDGIIFIQYPHALNLKDTLYPNRNYICYSPNLIEETASKYFSVITHQQSYNGKKVTKYDNAPYVQSGFTFKNGYLLVARKR